MAIRIAMPVSGHTGPMSSSRAWHVCDNNQTKVGKFRNYAYQLQNKCLKDLETRSGQKVDLLKRKL